jgi:hypothetical protein
MGLAAVAVLAISVEEVSNRIYRRRAERLLQDIRQLRVGKSTFENARALILRYHGGVSPYDHAPCSPAHCTFEVALKHYPFFIEHWGQFLNSETGYRLLRMLPHLGLQDGDCGADVRVDRGIVTHLDCGVYVRGSGGWVLGRRIVEDETAPKYILDRMADRAYYLRYSNITTAGGGEAIETDLTPQANADERKRACDLDFGCLTKRGGCTSLCQLAPAAFADYVKQTGWMPRLDERDPNCAKFMPPAANPDNAKHP